MFYFALVVLLLIQLVTSCNDLKNQFKMAGSSHTLDQFKFLKNRALYEKAIKAFRDNVKSSFK